METKVCCKCKKEKSLDFFLFRNKIKQQYHGRCSECYKEIRQKSYNKHKQKDIDRARKNKRKLSEWFQNIKINLKCEKCPENHPATLDFHHKKSKEKILEVSRMVSEYYAKEKILKEIEKCSVLCSNCHRKIHNKNKNSLIGKTPDSKGQDQV